MGRGTAQRFALIAMGLALFSAPTLAERAPAVVREVRLSDEPHPPGDAPDVVAHVPAGYDAGAPLDVVVFLHGFECCARALVSPTDVPCRRGEPAARAWNLAAIHTRAATNTVLLVPQLAYRAREAHAHRFRTRGSFDAMLSESLAALSDVLGPRTLDDVRSVTLAAHSGGYGAVVPILRDTTRRANVNAVVMLDALYAGWDVLAHWALAAPDRRIVSLHTRQAQTVRGNERLRVLLASRRPVSAREDALSNAVRAAPFVIAQVRTAHGDVPAAHLADVLGGLPLGHLPR